MNDNLPIVNPTQLTPAQAEAGRQAGGFFSSSQMNFTLLIMGFGLIALVMFLLLARAEKTTPQFLRLYVVVVLIVGTLLVVSSTFSTGQTAPIVGFFGTLAGYLLGRGEKSNEN